MTTFSLVSIFIFLVLAGSSGLSEGLLQQSITLLERKVCYVRNNYMYICIYVMERAEKPGNQQILDVFIFTSYFKIKW